MQKLLILAITMLLATSISAQQEIVLDNVTNSIGDVALVAGNTHILSIRYRNLFTGACAEGDFPATFNTVNGFRLFSPDGATWNLSAGTSTQELLDAPRTGWSRVFINHFEDPLVGGDPLAGPNDGVSPDYIGIAAIGALFLDGGLPFGFDEISLQIEIETNLSDTGLQICIDSSSIGRLRDWFWIGIARSECNVAPNWGGPYCFTIVAPTCGDANSNRQVTDDDLTFLIQFYFGFGPPPAPGTGDVNSDGTIDIGDIVYLANFLHKGGPAPCAGTGPGGLDWKQDPDRHQVGNE